MNQSLLSPLCLRQTFTHLANPEPNEIAMANNRPKNTDQSASSSGKAGKRPYLNRENRRQKLLDEAAALVEERGWTALTMSALAEQGGTSRQLVYLHFPNLEELLGATARHIFNDTMELTLSSITAHPEDLVSAARAAETVSLDLPVGRGDALWQLIAGTAAATPELEKVRHEIRATITHLWEERVKQALGLPDKEARAVAWMMVMSFWGMRQLVRDGKISRERGVALFTQLVERLVAP